MSDEIPDQIPASEAHEVAFQDVRALLLRHGGAMSALELLAIAANLVGKIIAFMDQRQVTPAKAMRIVEINIELGNRQALESLRGESSGRA